MNKDLSLNNYTNVNYLHAENLRLRSKEGEATTALSNHILGTNYKITIPTNHVINGILDITSTETIIFTINTSTSASYIYKFIHDGTDVAQSIGTNLYDDTGTSDKLGFDVNYPIKGVTRIETENIIKIYWINGLHSLRYMNIETPGVYTDASDFEQIPTFDTSEISFTGYTGGTMYAGKYTYVYQLFKTNGAETVFTSNGELISVSTAIGVGESLVTIRGTEKDTITNRGVKLNIAGLDTSFTRIRVLAIQYEDLYISPTVRIITEQAYSTSSIDIIDYGQSFGTYGLDEIQFIYPDLIPETIEVKNNILFLGNIDETTTDIQTGIDAWDATAKSYSSAPATYGQDVNEDFDTYKFQSNGSTYGASGTNIDWSFTTENKRIGTYDVTNFDSLKQFSFDTSSIDDAAFGIKTTWQRGEVYRYGIQFFDEKGRKAFTKWSCDLRIPRAQDGYDMANVTSTTHINASYIYPVAVVKNLPSVGGVPLKWKIVYVERGVENKSILASGIFDFPNDEGSVKDFQHVIPTVDDYINNYIPGGPGIPNYWRQFPNFVSPEINFGSDDYQLAESIEYTSSLTHGSNARKTYTNPGGVSTSYTPISSPTFAFIQQTYYYSDYITCPSASIIDKVKTTPNKVGDSVYNLDGTGVTHYVINHGGGGNINRGMQGTSLLIKVSAPTIAAHGGTDNIAILYGHLIRNLSVQYGGNSDEARAANSYISCSDLTDSVGNITCHYGDTFIQMYDYLRSMKDEDTHPDFTNVIYFPVETQVNLSLRDDDCYHKLTNYDIDTVIRNMHEDGFVDLDQGITLSKLYTYNNSYSRLNDLYTYIPKPFDYQSSEIFTTRVRRSNIKINGESADSWLKFLSSNYIDIDSRYGDIHRLKTFKNRLTFWQEGAFGTFPVGEKELVASGGDEALNVGSTGILDRFDYISEHNGISSHDALVVSKSNMYFYDNRFKTISKYSGGIEPVSFVYGMDSWFDQIITNFQGIQGVFDQNNNEILFVIKNGSTPYVLVLDEYSKCFSNFFTMPFINKIYEMQNTLFSSNTNVTTEFHEHDKGDLCRYHGASASPSKLTLVINPKPQQNIISVFDVLEILTNVTSSVGVDLYETFNTIRIYNEYQDSGTITLTPGSNIIRRFRTWRINTLRANTLNKPKFVNSWIKVELSFTNVSNKELILYNLTTNYKPSKMMR